MADDLTPAPAAGATLASVAATPATPATPAVAQAPAVAPVAMPAVAAPAPNGDAPAATPVATPEPIKGDWPDTWRERMAGMVEKDGQWTGGDEKLLKRLQRMASPLDTGKTLREQDVALSKRAVPGLPKDATPEQVSAYREQMGIPETPDGYQLDTLPSGIVIGEEDKPLVGKFAERMHAKHATPELVTEALETYYELQEEQHTEWVAQQVAAKAQCQEELYKEWGADGARSNLAAIKNMFSLLPPGVAEKLEHATLPDGTVLGNDPDTMRGLALLGRELNPAGVVVPNANGNQIQSIDAELAKIQERRKTDYHAFMRDEPLRARELDLLTAKDKMSARGLT